ncbi:hypothetical protein [Bacillus taeanensis]|uniref:hypothetical protein n=1 Tax=Bacillus taeanensis TaxID=273032 RepID=UPI0015F006B0|nr:hypothetical protein [Bacillus taeanensis]
MKDHQHRNEKKEKQKKADMTVDSLPLEDIKEEYREEKDKRGTKDESSSEKKYKP